MYLIFERVTVTIWGKKKMFLKNYYYLNYKNVQNYILKVLLLDNFASRSIFHVFPSLHPFSSSSSSFF